MEETRMPAQHFVNTMITLCVLSSGQNDQNDAVTFMGRADR